MFFCTFVGKIKYYNVMFESAPLIEKDVYIKALMGETSEEANDIVDKINSKISSCEETDNLSFASYLNTIRKNDIRDLDINNAPDNVEKPQPIPDALTQQKEIHSLAMSFSDFKKKNGYKRSIELSEQYSLYRQDYCGCVFSKRDAEKRRQEKPQDQFNNKTNHQL